jgi:uncharacterized protein DUF5684
MDPDKYQGMQQPGPGGIIALLIMSVIYLAVLAVILAGLWKIFVKMGRPGWEGIVPILNLIRMIEAIGKPIWWIVLCFIPCVNFVVLIIIAIGFAERFGKGAGFGLGLVFLPFIFYPILGFGGAKYLGPKPMAV